MDSRWLRAPRFRTDEGEHRQATWLELFFDLVFVVAVAGLAGLLREDLSPSGFAWFAFLFLPTWWLWTDYSYYADQFDSDDVLYRLALLAAMFGIVTVSRTAPEIVRGEAAWGGLVFAGMYAVLGGLYARALRPNPDLRSLTKRYVVADVLAAGLYAASAFVPPPWRFALWGVAVFALMANSPLAYYQLPGLPSQLSHMPERFGLFTIIALGESVVGVAEGVAETPGTAAVLAASLAGFALGAGLWWTYFIRDDPSALSAALDAGRRALVVSHVYGYAHYFVYAGIVAASVGVEEAIIAMGEGHALEPGARWALGGGTAVALAGIATVHRAAARPLPTSAFAVRLAVAGLLGVLALLPLGLTPWAFLLATTGAVLALALALFETLTLPHPARLPDEAAADAAD